MFWFFWLCVDFGKLFWLGCNGVCGFFRVWMYEYFGVDPQVREEVDGIYPRFLHWLPKYRLLTPSKRYLEVWHMLIDNLIVANVSFFFFFLGGILCLKVFVIWLWFGLLFILGSL